MTLRRQISAPFLLSTRGIILFLCLSLSCISISSVAIAQAYKDTFISNPEIGVVTTAPLGERLIYMAQGQYHQCFIASIDFGKYNKLYNPNGLSRVLCKPTPDSNYLYNLKGSGSERSVDVGGMYQFSKDGKVIFCYNSRGGICSKPINPGSLEPVEPFFFARNSGYHKYITYNGREGNSLKFSYLETGSDYRDVKFNSQFVHDIGVGKLLSYKGISAEVISADNLTITYKVIRASLP